MEARDTVLKPEERGKYYAEQLKEGLVNEGFILPAYELDTIVINTCQAQAEITGKIMYDEGFKAGREEERSFILQNTDRDIRARKEGRKEVVEYRSEELMEYHDKYCEEKKVVILVVPQAQLKEWEGE